MDTPGEISTTRPEGLTRGTFLRAAAAVGGAAAIGSGGLTWAAADDGGATGRSVERLGPITGPGITTQFRMERMDLGVPARCPDGRVLYVFGDCFEHALPVEDNFWRSPTGLYTDGSHPSGGIEWTTSVGGETAQQLFPYVHDGPDISTAIPSDVMTIGDTMYLQVWCCFPTFPTLKRTEIWSSTDNGATWQHTGASWDADFYDGNFQLITWHPHEDGYVYIYSSRYRVGPLYLWRVPQDRIGDTTAYETYGYDEATGWGWGNEPTPVRDGKYGEMTLRPVEDTWVLTFFQDPNGEGEDFPNAYTIQALFFDEPWSDLTQARTEVLLHGTAWGQEDDSHVAQLYGGYIVPGSTLDDLHLTVSQWNTETQWPYHTEHFRFRGFGRDR